MSASTIVARLAEDHLLPSRHANPQKCCTHYGHVVAVQTGTATATAHRERLPGGSVHRRWGAARRALQVRICLRVSPVLSAMMLRMMRTKRDMNCIGQASITTNFCYTLGMHARVWDALHCPTVQTTLNPASPTTCLALCQLPASPKDAHVAYASTCCFLGKSVGTDRGQGWTVDGCLAESPAEEAGILQGDLIIEIGASYNLQLTHSKC